MSETPMVKVTIDGTEVEVPKGTTIYNAAKSIGVDIPTFCYHPGLSIPANCRMCLVNVERARKLEPACYAQCGDGMVVHTQDEKVLRTRKSTLEFILIHHPVDCPICDQAGECVLQDNYFAHSASPSRLFTRKEHKPKAEVIGPNVILDAERCILCTRCVRFCEEVTQTRELQVVNRGDRAYITTFPGQQVDNDYATCVTDICPVGALTSRDFRFKMRVWFLKSADSVCGGCARGCNISLDHGDDEVQRYAPRENLDVNKWWMCDAGRLSYKEFQQDRIDGGLIGDRQHPMREVIGAAARKVIRHGDKATIAVIPSLMMTNEDLWALSQLTERLGLGSWYIGGRADGKADDILQVADKNPNRAGVMAAGQGHTAPLAQLAADIDSGKVTAALWFGHEHAEDAAVLGALGKLSWRVVFASNQTGWTQGADVTVPICTFEEVEGSWTNVDGLEQRINPGPDAAGVAVPTWNAIGQVALKLGHLDLKPAASAADIRAAAAQNVTEAL